MSLAAFRPPLRGLRLAAALLAVLPAAAGAQGSHVAGPSLDSLLSLRVDAASKYSQRAAEAPASVTIIGADDIRRHGWVDLLEALETVRGLYASNDRNYPYLGTRGFSRPTDYNNRVLLLVDGHTINEQMWGSATVGSDLPIDLDAVERIEVVRGPGSVLYGTSAMFAVINIVTKTGTALDGAVVSARAGTGGLRQGAIAAGRALGARGSVAASGLLRRSDGLTRYYAEFDEPGATDGTARGLDWEDGASALGSLSWDGIEARVGYYSRSKGIPTGSYGMAFGDARAETVDGSAWAELRATRELGATRRLSARLYADRYRYRGVYPDGPDAPPTEGAKADWLGGEAVLVWDPASRNRLTAGVELRRVARALFYERLSDGTRTRANAPFSVASLFVQDELQLGARARLVGGVRVESRTGVDVAATPRVALVATPDRHTTAKLLYGQGFRAPSPGEGALETSVYLGNDALGPERIATLELEVQRRVVDPLLVTLSLYDNRIRDLVDPVEVVNVAMMQYRNQASSRGRGAELEVDVMPGGPASARIGYALQRTRDDGSGATLTNSPRHIATLALVTREWNGARSALVVRRESPRRTIADTWTPSFARTDLNLGWAPTALAGPAWARGLDLSLRVVNLFDTRWSVPGGLEHRQPMLEQDGRTLTVRLGLTL